MTTPAKSTIILCADDFGISPGVDRAILDLAAKGRLSAVSCMSLGPDWEEGGKALKRLRDKVQAGLHLTLTYLPPLTPELGERHPAGQKLLLQSWTRCLDKNLVEKEIRAQLERFIKAYGAPPDFIDGHQHVHVLPVIRDILLRLREEYAPRCWMRNVVDLTALTDSYKYGILTVMGWRWLQLLKKHGIAHNKHMRGTYDYTQPVDYAALMEKWVGSLHNRHPREGGDPEQQITNSCPMTLDPHLRGGDMSLGDPLLIYCHPGFPDAGLAKYDSVLEPRRHEYDFFNSDVFGTILQEKIRLRWQP